MTKQELIIAIQSDLGANYKTSDEGVLSSIVEDVINDALFFSNRLYKSSLSDDEYEKQLTILSSEIKGCVKTIYLQRGAEDVNSQLESGTTSYYNDAKAIMRKNIANGGKRILF